MPVALPHVNNGISLAQSYIFAPAIFFLLHIQALFLLRVLARKIGTFETRLEGVFADQHSPQRQECSDWLSAFSFVQLFNKDNKISTIAKFLVWFGTCGIPVVLLFLIDISFIRFQSLMVTISHHTWFVLDLAAIWWFNKEVYPRRIQTYPGHNKDRKTSNQFSLKHIIDCSRLFLTRIPRIFNRSIATLMVLTLAFYAWPPEYDPELEASSEGANILRGRVEYGLTSALLSNENLLDAVFCHSWGWACRRLNGQSLLLTRTGELGSAGESNAALATTDTQIHRMKHGLDLSGRSLRYANFQSAWLSGAILNNADLRGAFLRDTLLQAADLSGSKLTGAYMYQVKLNYADLRNVQIDDAELSGAELKNADLSEANLNRTSLGGADITNANFHKAQLIDSNLHVPAMRHANFHAAKLQRATVRVGRMECVNFHAANLSEAVVDVSEMSCSNFHAAEMIGATIDISDIFCSSFHAVKFGDGQENSYENLSGRQSCHVASCDCERKH